MEKCYLCYTCTRTDCEDNCQLVMLIPDPDELRTTGRNTAAAMLDHLLKRNCSHYLSPIPESSAAGMPF